MGRKVLGGWRRKMKRKRKGALVVVVVAADRERRKGVGLEGRSPEEGKRAGEGDGGGVSSETSWKAL